MRASLVITLCLTSLAQTAPAETVIPARYGDWEVSCFSGITGNGEASCHIDRRIWRFDNSGAQVSMGITITTGLDERISLTTSGLDAATCEQVTLQEVLPRGYDPRNSPPSEAVITSMQQRIAAAIRSHLQILAICTPMKRRIGPFPVARFDESVPDLRGAIEAVEVRWTARRHEVNPIARVRESNH